MQFREDKSVKEVDLPNDRYRQYLTAKETIKHVISSCVARLPGITAEGTRAQPEWQAALQSALRGQLWPRGSLGSQSLGVAPGSSFCREPCDSVFFIHRMGLLVVCATWDYCEDEMR